MAAVIGSLRAELSATIAKFQDDMGRAAKTVKDLSREFSKVGNDFKRIGTQMQSVGMAMTKTITLPLVALGVGVAKVGMDFESAFAGVRKTVQATEPEFAQMAQGFRNLAKEIPISVNELAKLGETAGALGIPKKEVVEFAKVMALLGVTTNVTSDQAAESIAKIQNIFGAAGKDTQQFASTLVALGNDGASTEDQILSMATRIAGAGNAIGLTQGQVLGFASALSSVGLEAEAGGSAISRVFLEMATAVSKGGTAVEGFARVAGTSVAEFQRLFKDDAATAVEHFVSGLGRIKESGGNLIGTLDELGFSELRVRDTLLRAAGAGDLLRKSLALQGQAWQDNSALTKEADERFKTTASQLTLLGNRVKDVGITLFTAMRPAIESALTALNALLPVITAVAQAFASLPGGVQLAVIGVLAFAAALWPITYLGGQVVASLGSMILFFGKAGLGTRVLVGGLTLVTNALRAFQTAVVVNGVLMAEWGAGTIALGGTFASAIAVLTGPVGWIIGISAAILTATGTWDEFFRILKAGAEIVGNLVVGAFSRFVDVGRPVVRLIGDLIAVVNKIIGFTEGMRAFASAVAAGMGWIADKAERASAALRGLTPAEFQAQLAAQRKELEKTAPAVNQTADAFKNLKDRLSGALASKDIGELTKAVHELSSEGALTWPVMRKIAAEAAALQAQGGKLTPELESILKSLKVFDAQQPAVAGLGKIKGAIDTVSVAAKKTADDLAALADRLHEIEGATPTFTIVSTTAALESLGTVASAADGVLKDLEGTSIDAGHAIGKLPAATKSWGAALADVADDAQSMGASVQEALGKIPNLLIAAFTGGGGLAGAFKAIGVMLVESILTPLMNGLSKVSKLAVTAGASMAVALGQASGMGSTASAITGIGVGLAGAAVAGSAWGTSMAAAGVAGTVALGAVTLGIGAAAVGVYALYKSFKGVTEAVKEARTAVGEFEAQLHATLTMQQSMEAGGEPWKASLIAVRDAYAALGLSAEQAEADVAAMWAAAELGPEAAKAAMDKINASFVKLREITDAIHGMGFQTTEELQALADKAKAVFDFMERSGKYTAEQLAIAWEAFTHAQAVALGDLSATMADTAAAAGFKTRDQLQQTADKAVELYEYMRDSGLYTWAQIEEAQKRALDAQNEALGQASGAVDSLSAKFKSLSDSVSKEAPERVMGSIEKATRAEMAVLKAQMETQTSALKANGKAAADALEKELADIDPNPVYVKVIWDIPPLPRGGGSREAPEPGDPHPSGPPGYSFAGGSGGIRDFGLGTEVTLHGREGVYTEAQINDMDSGQAAASQSAGGMTVNISIVVEGSVLAEKEYIETTLVEPILTGIERNFRPKFERLVRGVR